MHPPRRVLWWLLALPTLPACSASSLFEVDVVFPRNATYAPSSRFPIVLAFKNSELAKNLRPVVRSNVWNGTKPREQSVGTPLLLTPTTWNITSDESVSLRVYTIDLSQNEGQHGYLLWWSYKRCNDDIGSPPRGSNGDMTQADYPVISDTSGDERVNVWFTINKDAPKLDLVAATSDERACLAQPQPQPGVTVTLGQTREYPAFTPSGLAVVTEAGTCEVQPVFEALTDSSPCRVRIDAAASTSIAALLDEPHCQRTPRPAECSKPKENAAGQLLAAAMVASLTAAFGGVGFLLG
ncbi:hypothetical protein QBC39DRAFT_349871 [Podospora conica]|nr:hypothetical protein QBC39DRAFT_349871 [Schizothecium conicum]